jgi:hypothetical protein
LFQALAIYKTLDTERTDETIMSDAGASVAADERKDIYETAMNRIQAEKLAAALHTEIISESAEGRSGPSDPSKTHS